MGRRYYHRHYYRRGYSYRRHGSSLRSAARSAERVARFGGRTVGRASLGILKFGTKAASHLIVGGVSTACKIIRSVSRS
jgi:hypothetical protein